MAAALVKYAAGVAGDVIFGIQALCLRENIIVLSVAIVNLNCLDLALVHKKDPAVIREIGWI